MNRGTWLLVGFVGSLSVAFAAFGLLWLLDFREPAGVVLSAGVAATLLGFGYVGYQHLTPGLDDDGPEP
ncbi:hypothetical protein [Haloplanus halobius]|uniref:hypothetical protein n=1 Tax=Haloplanus halobius TaxID=2934938 RepID=UPI00200D1EE1|nr:hypothetical protein [Haloplanus sp. XH21]